MPSRTPKPFSERQVTVGRQVMRVMAGANTWLYRTTRGRVGNRFPGGAPILLLTTIGRRTGKERTVPLLYLDEGDRLVVVASQGGMPTDPEWYLNLVDDPNVSVEAAGEQRPMLARVVDSDEKAELWPRLVAMYSGYDGYQARAGRDIPVVVLTPA